MWNAVRCPIKPPASGANLVGHAALGLYFKGTVSEGWYFGTIKEQDKKNKNMLTIKYGTTTEETPLQVRRATPKPPTPGRHSPTLTIWCVCRT